VTLQKSLSPELDRASEKQPTMVRLIETARFADDRGWFSETYSTARLARIGIETTFVQDNQSFSRAAGTIRGLHFQLPPHAQAKLVRCIQGRIFDVAVDIRAGSPTYGRWVGAELSAENMRQLFVPAGFAHGFATLEPGSEVVYKVDRPYAPGHEAGIHWADPELAVDWRIPDGIAPILSPKDELLPAWSGFKSPFAYDGTPLTPLGD